MKQKLLLPLLIAGTFPIVPASAKSLWANTAPARSAYSDRVARFPGDILTVFIDETTSLTSTQRRSSERSSDISSEVKQFLFSPIASKFGTKNGELPATDISSGASSDSEAPSSFASVSSCSWSSEFTSGLGACDSLDVLPGAVLAPDACGASLAIAA